MAAGTAASDKSANRTANRDLSLRRRLALLLDVWTANGGGWNLAPDDTGDGDQGQDVRERLEENRPRGGLRGREIGQPLRQGARKAEQEGCRPGAERAPTAEDQRGERDEPAPGRHVLAERVHETEGQVDAAERREHARERHRRVANAEDR